MIDLYRLCILGSFSRACRFTEHIGISGIAFLSMSAARTKLKQIQKLLKEEDYEAVVSTTKELLKEEKGQGQNVYNALVFAGVALNKLGRNDEAEKVCQVVLRLNQIDQKLTLGVLASYQAFSGTTTRIPRCQQALCGDRAVGKACTAIAVANHSLGQQVRTTMGAEMPMLMPSQYSATMLMLVRDNCRSYCRYSKSMVLRKKYVFVQSTKPTWTLTSGYGRLHE